MHSNSEKVKPVRTQVLEWHTVAEAETWKDETQILAKTMKLNGRGFYYIEFFSVKRAIMSCGGNALFAKLED